MPAFLVAEFVVRDAAKLTEYGERVAPVVRNHGGTVLVREPHRAVLAFDSVGAVERFLACPAYRSLVPLRDSAAETRLLVVAPE